jgi:hypothetical protein
MFRGQLRDGAASPGAESLEVGLFAEEEIPWEQLAFTVVGKRCANISPSAGLACSTCMSAISSVSPMTGSASIIITDPLEVVRACVVYIEQAKLSPTLNPKTARE